MSYAYVVLANETLAGARCVVEVTSVPEFEARGWTVVGPTTAAELSEQRSTARTDAEQAEHEAAALAHLAALTPAAPAAKPTKSAPAAATDSES